MPDEFGMVLYGYAQAKSRTQVKSLEPTVRVSALIPTSTAFLDVRRQSLKIPSRQAQEILSCFLGKLANDYQELILGPIHTRKPFLVMSLQMLRDTISEGTLGDEGNIPKDLF